MRMSSSGIPELFRCPISLDLFVDPVTLCTGLTYDRASIEQWLASGNLTCPVTMQRLRDTTLVPNRTLRHLIHQWLLSTLKTIDYADPKLELVVIRKVKSLADESDKARYCLLELGVLPLLLRLLLKWRQRREELMEDVLHCVARFASSSHMGCFNVLLQESNMAAVVALLEQGGIRVKSGLCELISLIASGDSSTRELCLVLGQNRRVVRSLVSTLALVSTSATAARAIEALCAAADENKEVAVEEGAVEGLIEYLWRGGGREAVAAVEQLAKVDSGREKLVTSENGIRVVVRTVFRVSSTDDAGSEHALGCLWTACCLSARARADAVAAGALSQLLLLLQSQCGFVVKAKARALLKLLTSSTHNHHDLRTRNLSMD